MLALNWRVAHSLDLREITAWQAEIEVGGPTASWPGIISQPLVSLFKVAFCKSLSLIIIIIIII